ncbi:hypothetical protein JVT61DRAFT_11071 [Boletus reticuloceps]|uniref:Uncharacterized protein n=1 Tax=Boletus reticuloceps TaxID=495285 RepID=A0A8I2YF15_9AGAM|nr:hypothetical protein JVT61DRAFT_11071 [Boletus reticuloceps]
MPAAHYSLYSCDLFISYDNEDCRIFCAAFWKTRNAVRCISCSFPGLPNVPHEFLPNSHKCEDQGLQDWILILCYYIWEVEKLWERVFMLLSISCDAFGINSKGRDLYAKWLRFNSGHHVALHSCNLLDVMLILSSDYDQLFGTVAIS